MCGIAGIVNKLGERVDAMQLQAMTHAVSHRGPDGEGTAIFESVGLGQRRLAILDLSPQGAQPMAYREGRLQIVHNGEIYNYRELRQELQALGYAFTSQTDTEVILAAYDAWGEDCVQRFNGMWAFAISDVARRVLFCSRDRFGVKPFYYVETATQFAFGSEIRQLLPFLGEVKAHLPSLVRFIATSAIDVDVQTCFDNVKRLLPGHSLRLSLDDPRPDIRAYYTLQRTANTALSDEDAATRLHDLLQDSVRLRLRSDVTVGTCLSGGLDSSSIATLAANLSEPGKFSAITAVSEQESNNEEHFAHIVAEHAQLQWHRVKPDYEDFLSSLPAVVRAQEEPFGSASIVMQYWVMKTARAQNIPVLLDGQGSDELLLGYERYYVPASLSMLRQNGLLTAWRNLRAIRRNHPHMHWGTLLKHLLGLASSAVRYGYYTHRHRYLKTLPARMPHLEDLAQSVTDTWRLQVLDITSTNLPVLLRYEDKNAMAHGIETRLPFLDYRMVEYALSLPVTQKIRDGWSKWLLRKAMQATLPDSITWRKDKLGFEAPEVIWLSRHAEIMQHCIFSSPIIRSLSDMQRLKKAYPKLDVRSRFRLYSVALWAETFGVSTASPAE